MIADDREMGLHLGDHRFVLAERRNMNRLGRNYSYVGIRGFSRPTDYNYRYWDLNTVYFDANFPYEVLSVFLEDQF